MKEGECRVVVVKVNLLWMMILTNTHCFPQAGVEVRVGAVTTALGLNKLGNVAAGDSETESFRVCSMSSGDQASLKQSSCS